MHNKLTVGLMIFLITSIVFESLKLYKAQDKTIIAARQFDKVY